MHLPQYFYYIQLILGIFTLLYLLKSRNPRKSAVGSKEKKFITFLSIGGIILFVAGIFFVGQYSLTNTYRVLIITLTIVWTIAALYIFVRK